MSSFSPGDHKPSHQLYQPLHQPPFTETGCREAFFMPVFTPLLCCRTFRATSIMSFILSCRAYHKFAVHLQCTKQNRRVMIILAKEKERADAAERQRAVEVNATPADFFVSSGCLRFSPTETWGVAELSGLNRRMPGSLYPFLRAPNTSTHKDSAVSKPRRNPLTGTALFLCPNPRGRRQSCERNSRGKRKHDRMG